MCHFWEAKNVLRLFYIHFLKSVLGLQRLRNVVLKTRPIILNLQNFTISIYQLPVFQNLNRQKILPPSDQTDGTQLILNTRHRKAKRLDSNPLTQLLPLCHHSMTENKKCDIN